MPISKQPSKLSLPRINPGVSSVLQYLTLKFPSITNAVWRQRMLDGKVHWHDGRLISAETPYQPQQRVYYYREATAEPVIAFKPHLLPVTPRGAPILISACKTG